MDRRIPWFVFVLLLLVILLLTSAGGAALVVRAYNQRHEGHIYPGVNVYGIDVGGMTVEEAAAALQAGLPHPAAMTLNLRDGNRVWSRSWASLGLHFHPQATADLAYRVGREGERDQQYSDRLQALVAGWMLSPVIILPNPTQAAVVLKELAAEATVPPVNAALIIQPEGIISLPAQAGRELDVEATIAAMAQAIHVAPEGLVMELLTRQVQPAIGNHSPALAQAEALLAQPFTLAAQDTLTDFSATWAVEPQEVATWLVAQPVEASPEASDTRLVLQAQEEAIQATLENLGSQLTEEIAINVEMTVPAIRTAVEAGQTQATVVLKHPSRTYTIRQGDTLMSVGRAHGFPVWWLVEANPGIEPGELRPGQEIVIPSIDILFEFPLITDRHILVDISDLRLYAYEGETLVYDFSCSTGIESSPTIPGMFQVLSKEENAFASSWDLWMPHFIGIYRTGPDFTNGIHGLPTLSNGSILWEGYLGRQPISYGCIVIGLEEAAQLYSWVELGTLVMIQE